MSDSEVCATWTSQSASSIQEGLALHINATPSATTAITVTKNVIYGLYWVFNVHIWNSSSSSPFTQIAQFSFPNDFTYLGTMDPLPWRICAETVGTTFQFKVWRPNVESEPSWTDASHSGSVTIPANYQAPGLSGWYIGHIPAGGGSASYTHMGIWSLP